LIRIGEKRYNERLPGRVRCPACKEFAIRMSCINGLFRSVLFCSLIAVTIIGLSGCGGGGGENPVSSTPSLPETPLVTLNASDLAAPGKTVENSFSQGALALQIPTAAKSERYAVLLVNNGTAESTIKVNGGGSSTISSFRSIVSSLAPVVRPVCGTPFVRNARQNAPASSIRMNIVSAVRPATANETLGQSYGFNVYSGDVSGLFSPTYVPRKGVLRRIGTYCKLFVDPEPFNGLSAADGGFYSITESQLDTLMTKFDQKIYPLMTQNYGPSYDMDGDGKVAVFLSPMVTRNGFAGFFDTEHFTTSMTSNQRDMFCMWTPDESWSGDRWLAGTCETIAHEFQHLINFSGRLKKASYNFSSVVEEEIWLDEALAMGAEIRYRQSIGDPVYEERFSYYMNYISSTSLMNFGNKLQDYGCVGMFAHYLFEQGDASRIQRLVTSGLRGKTNIETAFSDHPNAALRTFDGIYSNWTRAVFTEMNRNRIDVAGVAAHQKYLADFDLDRSSAVISYDGGGQGTLSAGTISMFIVQPPAGYSAETAALYLQAVSGSTQQTGASINCTIMRLNN